MASLVRITFMALGLILISVTVAFAEDAASGAGQGDISMVGLIFGNWTMWPLLILSVFGVSMAITRIMTITPDVLVPPGLCDDMHDIFAEGVDEEATEDAVNVVAGDASMLGEILVAGLDKKDFGYDSMVEAAEDTASAEHNKYLSQINWLSLFAAIGPMLGLLGTVVGMIGAFFKMAQAGGQVDAALLADQIGSAMLTTASGLIIAIPMLFVFFFLRARVNRSALEAGILSAEVLDYFRPVK